MALVTVVQNTLKVQESISKHSQAKLGCAQLIHSSMLRASLDMLQATSGHIPQRRQRERTPRRKTLSSNPKDRKRRVPNTEQLIHTLYRRATHTFHTSSWVTSTFSWSPCLLLLVNLFSRSSYVQEVFCQSRGNAFKPSAHGIENL